MIRYSIHKSILWERWFVRAHLGDRQSVCEWFDDWASAVGYVKSAFGWQW
jgi:hypothetical protein